ncbi:MAG TPA: hypothetical protein VGM92_12165 [Candidatus Kapabacteria bacterium]|jgi:hypothetical protein
MTHDERISAYIDNELNGDQEQEFLISLAASEGLRKSFRSELVLKNMLHRDEAGTNPPRRLRGAVFTALGLGMASAIGATKASAAESQPVAAVSRGLVHSLFATKVSTALTLALLTSSALVGYGVRTVTVPVSVPVSATRIALPLAAPATQPSVTPNLPQQAAPASEAGIQSEMAPVSNSVPAPTTLHTTKHNLAVQHSATVKRDSNEPVNGVSGGNTISMKPPKITPVH